MPHNRTRLWTGLAIAAVTIPAVGTYYFSSKGGALQGAPIAVAGRMGVAPLGGALSDEPSVVQNARRDYGAEVQAALGASEPVDSDAEAALSVYDDDLFDPEPPVESAPRIAYDPEGRTPEPAPLGDDPLPTQAAYTTDGPVSGDAVEVDPTATPTLSDANVYRLVVDNLPEDDRDEFVRAYAAMTNAQRVELLDGFRDQLENDAP